MEQELFLKRPIYNSEIIRPEESLPKYTPEDYPVHVYRYIEQRRYKNTIHYSIVKVIDYVRVRYITVNNIVDAVLERDHLERCNWDLELSCELVPVNPYFSENDLPKFQIRRDSKSQPRKRLKIFGQFRGAIYKEKNINPWRRVWASVIGYNYKVKYLGRFEDPLSASLVSKIAKNEIRNMGSA